MRVPVHLPTSKQLGQTDPDGEVVVPDPDVVVPLVVVVDPAGQLAGPLVQLEQLLVLVQLSMRLHIPLVESKVKSVQPLMPLHAV